MRIIKLLLSVKTANEFKNLSCICLFGALLFTNQVALAQTAIVSNLLINGTFESDLTGWDLENYSWIPTVWSAEGNNSPGSFRGTQNEMGGVFSNLDIGTQCIAVEAGEPYQLESSVKNREDNQVNGQALVYAVWPDTGCADPKQSKEFLPGLGIAHAYPVEFDDWLTGSTPFRIPEGISEVRIALSVIAYQGYDEEDRFGAYFDDISFGKIKPDLIAGINFGGQTAYPGDLVTFDVSINNKDGLFGTANDITAKVRGGKHLSLVSESCPGDMVNTIDGDSRWISWFNIPSLASGESLNCTVTAELMPGNATKIFPTLEVTCPECDYDPINNSTFDALAIGPRADIEARITAAPFQSIERRISVSVELENLGTKEWNELVVIQRPTGADLHSTSCTGSDITVEDANLLSFQVNVRPFRTHACVLYFDYPTPEESLTFSLSANSLPADDYDLSNNSDSATLTTVSLRVNTPLDYGDGDPGDGVCLTQVGRIRYCTLRGAIEEANALPGFQVVSLPLNATGYRLDRTGGDQHIAITDTVEIFGENQGTDSPRVFGNWTDSADRSRIFVIDSPTLPVEIRNLDLIGQNHLVSGNGGLVLIDNTEVTMENVFLEDGGANHRGGALYSNSNLVLKQVYVSGSQAPFGAGIAFEPTTPDGNLSLSRSRIYGNSHTPFSPQSQGGGIWANGGHVNIEQSSIDNNLSTRGGGLALSGDSIGKVENSTFSTNEADEAGGGMWLNPAIAVLNFVTFAHNSADSSSDSHGQGGGIFVSSASSVGVSNSVFANNQGQADGILPKGSTCFGTMISGGYNTFTPSTTIDADCLSNVNSGDNNSFQAVLAELEPTEYRKVPYHKLIAEGQDVDLADPTCKALDGSTLKKDQRLLSRPVDGNQNGTKRCDKGAVEARNGFPELSLDCPAQVSVESGSTTTISCSLESLNGASGDVYFSCLGAPPSCDFAPEPLALAVGGTDNVDVTIYGNSTSALSTITVDAILSPARSQAEIEVTTTGDLDADTIMINADINGNGSIISSPAGLDCSASCARSFPQTNNSIELTATPAAGWKFSGWTGDCAGVGIMLPDGSSSCTVNSSADRSVGAEFVEDQTITVSVAISGQGQVISTPAGIDCPGTCSAEFANSGDNIILTTNLDFGWYFTGWSGDCNGTGDCSLPRSSDQTVTAGFSFGPVPTDVIFQDGFE